MNGASIGASAWANEPMSRLHVGERIGEDHRYAEAAPEAFPHAGQQGAAAGEGDGVDRPAAGLRGEVVERVADLTRDLGDERVGGQQDTGGHVGGVPSGRCRFRLSASAPGIDSSVAIRSVMWRPDTLVSVRAKIGSPLCTTTTTIMPAPIDTTASVDGVGGSRRARTLAVTSMWSTREPGLLDGVDQRLHCVAGSSGQQDLAALVVLDLLERLEVEDRVLGR